MYVLARVKNTIPKPSDFNTSEQEGNIAVAMKAPAKADRITYPFVDLIRFVSTIGIVFIHAEFFLTNNQSAFFHKVNHIEYYFAMRQVFKFATICYFLIAGFLLADKIEKNERFNYFLRRLHVIVKPYVFAVLIFIVVFAFCRDAHQKINGSFVIKTFEYVLGYTSYWYVPNYVICLLVIIAFAKYVRSVYFGAILLLITLIYTYFTVYSSAHTSSHTTALFGFVFYMWLGIYIKKANLLAKVQKIPSSLMIAITLLIFALSCYETRYLFDFTHTRDSLNTLRISNQLYSLAIFALLVKLCGNKAPNFGVFRPKQETYGIYLYHGFFVFFVIPELEKWICNHYHFSLFSYNVSQLIAINLFNFVLCYFGTTLLVKTLIKLKLAYLPYE